MMRITANKPAALLFAWLFCFVFARWGAAAEAKGPETLTEAPRARVAQTVRQVLDVLAEPDLDDAQRRRRIEELAFSVFDFKTMSKLVLARNWKKFDKEERVVFVEEFKQYLSRNYGSRLERYQKAEVEVLGARVEPRNDVTVLTRVVGSQYDGISMNYRLRERKGEWKIIDIVVEGVSMLANFRAQFSEVVSREGVDGLLNAMRNRNAELDPTP
ncbi:MAG: ABC transporter substrate-binding protein [Myxococcota bacterium]|nr:ABC transporter substrate-binding protein [Myxococcota bacterium]